MKLGDAPPFVVWAGRQTAGRGQGANRWWSAEGGLMFSVAVAPDSYGLLPSQWPCVALASAVAVCRAVEGWIGEGVSRPEIKWPNDVWCEGRKLAGVLVEVVPGAGLVVGIGVNVNNGMGDVELAGVVRGVAVCELDGKVRSLEECLTGLLAELRRAWGELGAGDVVLSREWQGRSMLDGRRVRVRAGEWVREGVCEGLTEVGRLRLRGLDGVEEDVVAGRVEVVGE
jgi:BirA family transcriptional regulator, biotin operon repressor / biotin---[acetyl-CoA-carboxylase] ligase